ncbi:MAG TPA: hypothetical protein VGP69_03175 [Gaiellaceae bacterium]|jgi:4-amino-4-deoxy-L-arabinose transferase-like glycosyltransferase|nr:hypothetical protein [Gaiellaceae bacterium]
MRFAGLGFIVGWACYGIVATVALTLGSPLGVRTTLGICVALAASGLLVGRHVETVDLVPAPRYFRFPVGRMFAVLLFAYLAVLAWRSVPGQADTNWDSWAFWLPKARSLYYFHGLDSGLGGFVHFANQDYPPLGPALEATNFHFMGSTVAAPLQFQHWLFAVAFFAAGAALLRHRVAPELLWPVLAAVAFMPRFGSYLGSSLPDETIGMLVALAAVCAALWLLERRLTYVLLMTILTTAAALLKNEGLVYGLSVVVVVAVVAWRQERRPLLAVAVFAIPILALVPWKLWLVTHGLSASSPYYGLHDLAPLHLVAARGRLGTSIVEVAGYLFSPSRWLFVVPMALIAVVVARRQPLLTVLVGVFAFFSLAGLLLIYWIGSIPLHFWLATSAERTVMAIVITCGVLIPLLVAESVERGRIGSAPDARRLPDSGP